MCPSQIEVLSDFKPDEIDSKKALETDGTHSILKQLKGERADPVPVVNNSPSALSATATQVANASVEMLSLNHLMAMPRNVADALTKM